MNNTWQVKKISNIDEIPNIQEIKFKDNVLILDLEFTEVKATLIFDGILSYRIIDEGNAFRTLNTLDFNGKDWCFTSNLSDLIDWFNEESEFIHQNEYISYMVVTTDYIIEVLTNDYPIFELSLPR